MTGVAHPFSPQGRRAALRAMADDTVDLLIIGGGITGCGIARDAALRGLRVALVERDDFACGTSGRSSKLVHGGLRYLAYGDFAMVRESVREREVLKTIAPHLVHPLTFMLPVHKGAEQVKYRLAFWIYDRMAASTADRHRWLSRREVLERAPGLRMPLAGGFAYGEFMTDDARFTLENAQSAAEYGALVANHAPVTALLRERGWITGAQVRDALSGEEYTVRAAVVVNATGPWAEETLRLDGAPPARHRLRLSMGAHIIFSAVRLPLEGAVALESPAGKAGFAIRRWDSVYVGTTDDAYTGALNAVGAGRSAAAELLSLTRACFPSLNLTAADITGAWAGLRPLIAQEGRAPRDTSRHDEIWRSPDGLITIAGGKLTTYRPMAARVMRAVAQALGRSPGDEHLTAEVPLPGARGLAGRATDLRDHGLPPAATERISWLYGTQLADLLAQGPEWLEPLAPGVPALRGEVRLAVEREMAVTLTDFMDRRSGLLTFGPNQGRDAAAPAAAIMAGLLGWSETETARQLSGYEQRAALASDALSQL